MWGCVCRWAAARPVSDVACCLWPHGCSGCRRVRPPARSPHASLRLGVVDLEAWPSSVAAHRHLGPAPRATRASRFPPCVNPRLGVVDLEARPGPAAAHRHPPHRWGFSLLCTSHPGPAAHGRRRQAPQPGSAGLAVPSMREPAARSRRSRSPARPSGPSGTLHTGGAFHCCAHPIQASPPTGTAAKPHSQASLVPQLTRCPPHRRCLVCWWVIGVVLKPGQALPPPTGTHRHRGQAPRASRFPPCVNLRLGVVDLEARPGPPDPPVPSTPVGLFIAVHIPSRPRRPRAPPPSPTARPLLSRSSRVALHTGGAWCAGG